MIAFAFGAGLVLGMVVGATMMLFAGFRTDPVPEPPDEPTGISA